MKTLRNCPEGHEYYKSSDCPTCPICERQNKPLNGFMSVLSAPVRRALERESIDSEKKLATYTEKEILALHGVGKTVMPKLKEILLVKGLSFKK